MASTEDSMKNDELMFMIFLRNIGVPFVKRLDVIIGQLEGT
jgi:hypothetical protein